jgi:hypothetical protein
MDLAAENGEHDAARLWMGRGSRGGELVAGTSGISRLPHGRTGRGRRFAVPVRWRAASLRRRPAGPRAGMLSQHPGARPGGHRAPAVRHRMISNSQPGLLTVPGARGGTAGLLAAAAGRGPAGRGSRRGDVCRPRRPRGHLPQSGSRQPGPGRPAESGGTGRLDGPLGPLSAAGGIPLRRDRGTPVFGYQTRCRDAYSVEAPIAERSRPADDRSRAYPPVCVVAGAR